MIANNYFWTIVAGLSVGTFLIRGSIIGISHKVHLSQRQRELLSYIPAAVFPALVLPMVFFHKGEVSWLYGKERLVILILATIFSVFIKNILASLVFGLGLLYFLTHAF